MEIKNLTVTQQWDTPENIVSVEISALANSADLNTLNSVMRNYPSGIDFVISPSGQSLASNLASTSKPLWITGIYYNDEPGSEIVIVKFSDNTKIIKRLMPGDKFDLEAGVALALADKFTGSKRRFRKIVKEKAVKAARKKQQKENK